MFLSGKVEVLIVAPSCVLVMTPKKTIHQGRKSNDTENSQEGASRETSLERREGYQCQDRNFGAMTDKEAAPHKSTDGRPQRPESTSNAFMLSALCSLQGKKRGQSPTCASLLWSESRRVDQAKARHFLSMPTAGPRHKG